MRALFFILVPAGLAVCLCVLPIQTQPLQGRSGDTGYIDIDDPVPPQPGDIVINEVYPRPFSSGSEFVELFNRSVHTFDLQDLTIRDASSLPFPLSGGTSAFSPGTYTVLVADEIAFSDRFVGVPYTAPARWASLNNGGDVVILESGGVIIDSLFYAGSTVEIGRSLERIDPGAPSDSYNFALSEMVRKNRTVFFVFLSVLSRRVMPLWAAVFVCRIRRRAFGCQVPGEDALR